MRNPFYLLTLYGFLTFLSCADSTENQPAEALQTNLSIPLTAATNDVPSALTDVNREPRESSKKSTFEIVDSSIFKPQNKKIVLLKNEANKKLLLFKTKLQVNTDGTPLSYHPQDLGGKTKAINTIGNAVAIYKDGMEGNIFLKRGFYGEAMSVFERFRDSDYETTPPGYRISWKNVLIAENVGGKEKPCIFKSGKYKGYYASATALQNGLKTNKGDCNCNNQVNPIEIPALVLVGGKNNPLYQNGARLGDLLVAYNPKNKVVSYAIINDIGPRNKLGEGSVLLNMQLNQRTSFPKNRKDTYGLVTKNEVTIALIPASRKYNRQRPYTAENIENRIKVWMDENGFSDEADFVSFLEQYKTHL